MAELSREQRALLLRELDEFQAGRSNYKAVYDTVEGILADRLERVDHLAACPQMLDGHYACDCPTRLEQSLKLDILDLKKEVQFERERANRYKQDRSRLMNEILSLAAPLSWATNGTVDSALHQIRSYVEHLQGEAHLIDRLIEEQHKRCAYGTREGDGQTCDCKFFSPLLPRTSEVTGCAELRTAIRMLQGES